MEPDLAAGEERSGLGDSRQQAQKDTEGGVIQGTHLVCPPLLAPSFEIPNSRLVGTCFYSEGASEFMLMR